MGEMGFLRYQRFLRLILRPVQYNHSNGQLAFHPDITVKIEYTKGAVDGFSSAGDEDSEVFEDIYAQAIHNYDQARKWRVRPDPETPDSALAEALSAADAQAFRLAIDQDGLYQVSHQERVAAGLPDAAISLDFLRLFAPDGEAAFEPVVARPDSFGPGDHLRFYARVEPNRYSDSRVYWLVAGAGPGKAIDSENRPPSESPAQTYVSKTRIEENKIYRSVLPRLEGAEHWFWTLINAVDGQAARQDLTFETPAEALLDSDWSMTVNVIGFPTGLDEGTFAADLLLNGSGVGRLQWEGNVPYAGAVTFPGSLLRQGENTLTVEVPEGPRGVSSLVFVDWLQLEGPRRLRAHNASLEFSDANQPGSYLVSGFDSADLTAYDITDPLQPVKILGGVITPEDGGHEMAFGGGSTAPGRYFLSTPDGLHRPSSIQLARRSGLASPDNQVDYLVITHSDFAGELPPLVGFYEAQGLRVRVVDVQDIYNAFSNGMMDSDAIRSFIQYALSGWKRPGPAYVLLVGDGIFDFKDHLGTGEKNFIPPYPALADPWLGEIASDHRYASVLGVDPLADVLIGRFPVNTPNEARAMVSKALAYHQNATTSDDLRRLLFVADNPDTAGDFHAISDEASSAVPSGYAVDKVYLQNVQDDAARVRDRIDEELSRGSLIVNFLGHASITG
jgi:hypothetical protein